MTKRRSRDPDMLPEYDFSRGVRGRYAGWLANKRWWVTLDPDLVDLLSGSGDPVARLLGFPKRKRSKHERLVVCIPMTDDEFKPLRPMLERIGAKIEYRPARPGVAPRVRDETPLRRRAGSPRPRSRRAG